MLSDKYFEELPKFKDMKYWFYRDAFHHIHVIDIESAAELIVGEELTNNDLAIDESAITDLGTEAVCRIYVDWKSYKLRPEYLVGLVPTYNSETEMEDMYEKLLLGCSLIKLYDKLKSDPDEFILKIKTKCLDWVRSTDFYKCPASTQYHDSHSKGLLLHTLKVVDRIVCLAAAYPFNYRIKYESAVLVALVHDWCKIGLYVPYWKNVKNDSTGKWEQVQAYKYAEDRAIALGHGVSSMFLAMKFFNLTIEEASAIRHHMGRWNCPDAEVNELQQANRTYPLVHLLQFADQLAIVNY